MSCNCSKPKPKPEPTKCEVKVYDSTRIKSNYPERNELTKRGGIGVKIRGFNG